MGDLLTTVMVVVLGVGGLLAILGGLYWLTKLLPGRWTERGRVFVFLFPALFLMIIGLVVPAFRRFTPAPASAPRWPKARRPVNLTAMST